MKTESIIKYPIMKVVSSMTMFVSVKITGMRMWHLRLKIGILLLRLGAIVLGVKSKIVMEKG